MFTEALSLHTVSHVIAIYNKSRSSLKPEIKFNLTFPIRICWRDIPVDMIVLLKIELKSFLDKNLQFFCGNGIGGEIEVKDNFR